MQNDFVNEMQVRLQQVGAYTSDARNLAAQRGVEIQADAWKAQIAVQKAAELAQIEEGKQGRIAMLKADIRTKHESRQEEVHLSPEGCPLIRYTLLSGDHLQGALADVKDCQSEIWKPDLASGNSIKIILAFHFKNKLNEERNICFNMEKMSSGYILKKLKTAGVVLHCSGKKKAEWADKWIEFMISNATTVIVPTRRGFSRRKKDGKIYYSYTANDVLLWREVEKLC